MKNLMDMYLEYTEKRIKKYMKLIYAKYYVEGIVEEYLKTYINARYYNIINVEKPARAFYLRIIDELELKRDILVKRNQKEEELIKIINNVKNVFEYILFFDDVRNIENFKNIDSLREIIEKISETIKAELGTKISKENQEKLYKQITEDLIEKDVFLDRFDTEDFYIMLENYEKNEDIYFAELEHNVKMPIQYSENAIEKVFSEGIVAEDKLKVEYMLLSVVSIRDIISGNFKDIYIAEFETSLLSKRTKLNGILSIIGNQALQAKIYLKIDYDDYIKNQKKILEYTKKGFQFAIMLEKKQKTPEIIEKLKMFKIVINK